MWMASLLWGTHGAYPAPFLWKDPWAPRGSWGSALQAPTRWPPMAHPAPAPLLVKRGNSTAQRRVPLVTIDVKACGEAELLYVSDSGDRYVAMST